MCKRGTFYVFQYVLHRRIDPIQFLGVAFIVISIAVAKLPDILQSLELNTTSATLSEVNPIPPVAIALALVNACNSVGAAVYTEQLFKTSKAVSFLDQQFWLYTYGLIVSISVHFITDTTYTTSELIANVQELNTNVMTILVVAIIFSSISGIMVAFILKHLDNIVKDYTVSVSNVVTAIVARYVNIISTIEAKKYYLHIPLNV